MNIDYLVTGGAGFIGCALAQNLLAAPIAGQAPTLTAIDNLHPQVHPHNARPAALHASADLHVMDICDAAGWDTLLARVRPRIIVHLAAETGTGQSLDHPVRHTEVNVNGTAQLIEALNRSGHVPEQIILSSSRAVYGEGAWRDPADGSIFYAGSRSKMDLDQGRFEIFGPSGQAAVPMPHEADSTHPRPISVYGASKLMQEHLLSAWCASRAVPLNILRLQNVYGVGQSPYNPYTGIIGLFHRQAAAGKAINIYEDGHIGRDFVYIDDVVTAFLSAMQRPPEVARIVDVGSGKAISIGDAAVDIAHHYRAALPQVSGAYRHGDVRWATCSSEKLETVLGVTPAISFGEGNRRLSLWLRETGVLDS